MLQLLKPTSLQPVLRNKRTTATRSRCAAAKSCTRSLQLERALTPQGRPRATKGTKIYDRKQSRETASEHTLSIHVFLFHPLCFLSSLISSLTPNMLCRKSGMAQAKQKKARLCRRVSLSLFASSSTSEGWLLELQPAAAEAIEAARCQQKSKGP